MKNQKKLISFFLICHWFLLIASINTAPHFYGLSFLINEINLIDNFQRSLINIRTLLPVFSSLILIFLLFLFFNKKKSLNRFQLIFLAIFFTHMMGLILNDQKDFIFSNYYLCYFGVSTLILFYICDLKKINLYKYFYWIIIFALILIIFLIIYPKISKLENLNFYLLFHNNDLNLFGAANPRITGLSRSLAIINIFIILILLSLNNFFYKNILLLINLVLTVFLFFMQSRGTLICYISSITLLTVFLSNTKSVYKIKNLITLLLVPFLLYSLINFQINKNEKLINKKQFNTRIFSGNTSGRVDIWAYSIKNNNYKKIFGYGSQGDRFFLQDYNNKKLYGDNSSNIFIHSFLSGGIICLIIVLFFYYEIFKFFIKNRKKIFYRNNSLYFNFSILCIVFFLIRSFFENSFGLFSIDFLIMYLSLMYVISSTEITKAE